MAPQYRCRQLPLVLFCLMGRYKMNNNEFEVEEGQEVVRRTIVGGRPRARRTHKIRIPIGVEKVLCRAAADATFRRGLFEDRPATLKSLGDGLSATERTLLEAIPAASLQEMVGRIDLSRHTKSRLLRGVLAAAMLVSSTVVETGCFSAGVGPDESLEPFPDVVDVKPIECTGMEPEVTFDVPAEPDVIESQDVMADRGVLPEPDVK
jgi:hypothetical protein